MNIALARSSKVGQWVGVALFAVAMAWVESAVVLYLRSLAQQFDPYEPFQLPLGDHVLRAEMVREAATLVMLGSVGFLAGQTRRSRVALAIMAFGIWDVCYYVFLVPLTGWPRSLVDWDILFLLPLPWWGPVLAPVLIACLMIAGGTLVALGDSAERPVCPTRYPCLVALVGGLLALYVFMEDALRALPQGADKLVDLRPERFDWPLFLLGFALLSAPVVELAYRAKRSR
jgi:hypothetical protein